MELEITNAEGTSATAMANVTVEGTTATLNQVTVWGTGGDLGANELGISALLDAKSAILDQAEASGLDTVVINGIRMSFGGSGTTLNPGRVVQLIWRVADRG